MPLSEDEQRRLDEMERALRRDDPKFAAGQYIERIWLRRTVAAGATALTGMVLLVPGIVTTQAILVLGVIVWRDRVPVHGRRCRIDHPPPARLGGRLHRHRWAIRCRSLPRSVRRQ